MKGAVRTTITISSGCSRTHRRPSLTSRSITTTSSRNAHQINPEVTYPAARQTSLSEYCKTSAGSVAALDTSIGTSMRRSARRARSPIQSDESLCSIGKEASTAGAYGLRPRICGRSLIRCAKARPVHDLPRRRHDRLGSPNFQREAACASGPRERPQAAGSSPRRSELPPDYSAPLDGAQTAKPRHCLEARETRRSVVLQDETSTRVIRPVQGHAGAGGAPAASARSWPFDAGTRAGALKTVGARPAVVIRAVPSVRPQRRRVQTPWTQRMLPRVLPR